MKKMLLLVFALVVAGGLGCAPEPQGENAAPAGDCDSTLVVRTYRNLRGVIEQPPDAARQLYIRYEAIPDFTGPCGEESLDAGEILPFVLDQGIDPAGLNERDSVTFDLLVNWDTIPLPGIIVRIEKDDT